MTREHKWPKAIFYDSKNTLWDWDEVWIDACRDLLEKCKTTCTASRRSSRRRLANKMLSGGLIGSQYRHTI
jgi:hypothetical protein